MEYVISNRQKKSLLSFVESWEKEWENYNKRLEQYLATPKIVRWWKGIREPWCPSSHLYRIYENCSENIIVELRYWRNEFSIAVAVGRKGYKLNLVNNEKSPLLGSTGSNIEPEYTKFIESIIEQIRNIIQK